MLLAAFRVGGDAQLKLLLGGRQDLGYSDDEVFRANCAKAWWAMDVNVKNFVLLAWRRREMLLGGAVSLAGGFHIVPTTSRCRPESGASWQCRKPDDLREFWSPWIPKKRHRWQEGWRTNKRSGAAPFYAVYRGRRPGLFYRWDACLRSVGGLEDSSFGALDYFADYSRDEEWDVMCNDVDDEWGGPLSAVAPGLEDEFSS